ncbi:transposase [Shigella sonnei]|nr:transposase [Shigella sonnei]UXF96938.1 transposase [Shigella sonnei]
MSRKTQRYSKEFKAEAVRTVPENQLSISEGASRLSLPEGTFRTMGYRRQKRARYSWFPHGG